MASETAALDVSDKSILDKTRQTNGANDTMQLSYTLPSGRVIKSEYFKRDQGTKALIRWCDTIREQMEADAQDERDRNRMRAMEERARQQREATGLLVDPSGSVLAPASSMPSVPMPSMTTTAPAAPGSLTDPGTFIQQMLKAATDELAQASAVAEAAAVRYTQAAQNLQKWQALAASVGGLTNATGYASGAADPAGGSPVAGSAGASVPVKRRGRKPKNQQPAVVEATGGQ